MQAQERKGKFCPRCGRPTEKFYNNLCKNCFLETTSLIEKLPDRLVLRQCRNCGRIYVNDDFAMAIEGAVDILLRELLGRKDMQLLHSATYRIEGKRVHITVIVRLEDVEKVLEGGQRRIRHATLRVAIAFPFATPLGRRTESHG